VPFSSPLRQAKQALGGRLREIRGAAGLTQRDLARLAGWHSSKASRIEYGKQLPSENDIKQWCLHCGASDQIPDLVAMVRALDEMWVEWRRSLGTGTRHRQREQIVFEGGARLLRWYEALLVPGIVHTPDYARGVMSRIIDFYGVVNDLEQGVEARMERQRILYRGDHHLKLLLAEQCLYTVVADRSTMAAQLDRLLTVQGLARVSLGVVPRAARFDVLANSFIIFDNTKVMVETISAELAITQGREIALYAKAFDALSARAVYGADARSLIVTALNALSEQDEVSSSEV
jgi:transcriptional regulator with XRE-family HTH domain